MSLAHLSGLLKPVNLQQDRFQFQPEALQHDFHVHPCEGEGGVRSVEGRYVHTARCDFPSAFAPRRDNYDLSVVYFVNCNIHDGYGSWMTEQLRFVPADAFLKIVAVSSNCTREENLYERYRTFLEGRVRPDVGTVLECHDEPADAPTFEYHGIRAMWEMGQARPRSNSIVFYFHSKGLTRFGSFEEYQQKNKFLPRFTEFTLGQADRVLEAFDAFPHINKAGVFVGRPGWVWHNFMYARGSYLRTVEEPILTKNRYYYEGWIARDITASRRVHPGNVIRNFENVCDGYNIMTKHVTETLGISKLVPQYHANVFNMGSYWNNANATWELCKTA